MTSLIRYNLRPKYRELFQTISTLSPIVGTDAAHGFLQNETEGAPISRSGASAAPMTRVQDFGHSPRLGGRWGGVYRGERWRPLSTDYANGDEKKRLDTLRAGGTARTRECACGTLDIEIKSQEYCKLGKRLLENLTSSKVVRLHPVSK
jgi:hypothetical protein